MMDTVGALVRRGSEIHSQFRAQYGQNQSEIKLPNWPVPVLVFIAITAVITLTLVEYTYGNLIPTLIMVEDPNAAKYDPLETSDPLLGLDDNKKAPIEPEILAKPKPVTYNFRTTLAHLRARGGRRASLRGIGTYFVASVVVGHLTRFITFINFIPFRQIVAPVVAASIAAHFPLLWTHVVISESSQKRWYKRFAPLRTWKKIAGPTALSVLVQQVAVFVPVILFIQLNADHPQTVEEWTKVNCPMLMLKGFGVAALSFALWILLVIPAKVSLTRVQASLLSEEEEPIVPFDRSFGGKVVPAIVGGNGVLGMRDAWKTFSWNSRVRLVKAYIKVVAIQVAFTLLFTGLAIATILIAVGPENLKKLVEGIKDGNGNKATHA